VRLNGIRVGMALTGSHCTLEKVLPQMEKIIGEGGQVSAIISPSVDHTDTRFGESTTWKQRLVQVTGSKLINSITGAEPVGPKKLFHVVVVAPCTGNTLAKLATGITDTAVLMAAKAQLRNQLPVILGISTNDGLGLNAKNIGILLNTKNMYMIPFRQDNPYSKPNSLVAEMDLMLPAIEAALKGKQLQPLLLGPKSSEFTIV